jgi:hypothetical protein
LFKYRRFFASFDIHFFLAFLLIEAQFAGLARCPWLAKVWHVGSKRVNQVFFFSPLRRELPVAREMLRLSVWRLEADVGQEAAILSLRVWGHVGQVIEEASIEGWERLVMR